MTSPTFHTVVAVGYVGLAVRNYENAVRTYLFTFPAADAFFGVELKCNDVFQILELTHNSPFLLIHGSFAKFQLYSVSNLKQNAPPTTIPHP